ncbi:hypothetical protein Nepgr_019821 [Nepenthes gracilis]|uniref:Uncharacterized protein n=1 Tax=Nepenthes gracilis TaxID=150966 RepID=A0AAD3SVP0_NEPGR|nr:hypothetical protein Nepgr_019821 [Nepenthes gracilis]
MAAAQTVSSFRLPQLVLLSILLIPYHVKETSETHNSLTKISDVRGGVTWLVSPPPYCNRRMAVYSSPPSDCAPPPPPQPTNSPSTDQSTPLPATPMTLPPPSSLPPV